MTTSEVTSSEPSAAQLVEEGDVPTPTPEALYRDVTVWTHEPEYTRSLVIGKYIPSYELMTIYYYLLFSLALKRPADLENIILNVSIEDNCYTIEFPSQPISDVHRPEYCMFSIPEPNGEWLQMEERQRIDSLTR